MVLDTALLLRGDVVRKVQKHLQEAVFEFLLLAVFLFTAEVASEQVSQRFGLLYEADVYQLVLAVEGCSLVGWLAVLAENHADQLDYLLAYINLQLNLAEKSAQIPAQFLIVLQLNGVERARIDRNRQVLQDCDVLLWHGAQT